LTGQILVALDEVAHHIRICQGGDITQAVNSSLAIFLRIGRMIFPNRVLGMAGAKWIDFSVWVNDTIALTKAISSIDMNPFEW